jgi:hypothetical protein
MVKGVATSIITVTVLMGGLVACGEETQVATPTPKSETVIEETQVENEEVETSSTANQIDNNALDVLPPIGQILVI